MKTDPYLVPGQICEVWHIDYKFREIRYFSRHVIVGDNTTRPVFVRDYNAIGINAFESCYDHYRPIVTEWNFAPAWAVCSTVNHVGVVEFWSSNKIFPVDNSGKVWFWDYAPTPQIMICGICPDKSRYEGDAWKRSRIDRPKWAEVG